MIKKILQLIIAAWLIVAMVLPASAAPSLSPGGGGGGPVSVQLGSNWERESLGGGQFRLTQYLKPIAYQDGNGAWTRITNALGATGDSAFPVGVDELVQFRVKDKLRGNSPVIHFGKGQTHVRFTPLDTNNVDGVVDGQSITYPEAWDEADLRLTVAGHLVQKDVILRTGHPETFAFRIDSHKGLDVETLSTADFRILQPVLIDPTGVGESVPLTWVVTEQGGKTILTVTLPEGDWAGWVLDPTLTLQPGAAGGNDTLIETTAPSTNYSTLITMYVGDGASSNSAAAGLIKFDISSIPAAATISAVTLSLFESGAADTAGAGSWAVNLHRLLRNWVETQATWGIYSTGNSWTTAGARSDGNDRGAVVSAALTLDGVAASAFVDFTGATLIDDVQKIVDGTYANNYGWLMEAPAADYQGVLLSYNLFSASNHATPAQRPRLVVVYTVPAGGLTSGLSGLSGMSGMGN